MREYNRMLELSEKLGYKGFTTLQEKAFHEPSNYNLQKWLFVIGATSSGKTLIPLLNYFYQYLQNKQEGKNAKMLFAVPYRALAMQKKDEIEDLALRLGITLKIVLSTGEFRNDDMDILRGNVDIAVIIYEKVFMFAGMRNDFLDKYDLLVLDEIGLTQDQARGIKADFILVQAMINATIRVIALGTPFYNWKNYVDKFGFVQIQEDERPIILETYPIYYTKIGVNHVRKGCEAVQEGIFPKLHNSKCDINPCQRLDYVIEDICAYHLSRNHKILIFENNREEVRLLAQRLYKMLTDKGMLSLWIDKSECKKYIHQEIQINSEDELYGIMGEDDYRAFAYGIGYHNADIPASLRILIEKEFLRKEGRLRIVCSTETLVYGINSNADVVIIPNMMKQHIGDSQQSSFLHANEYMNYSGRAGRLDSELPVDEQKQIGYVYPFIKANYNILDERRENPEKDQKLLWDKLQEEIKNPQMISSCYYNSDKSQLPFYILNLFPNTMDDKSQRNSLPLHQIKEFINKIPNNGEVVLSSETQLLELLRMLMERKLIYITNDNDDEDENYEPELGLTDVGRRLSGYVINIEDFDKLMKTACRSITECDEYKVDLLLGIIESGELMEEMSMRISPISDFYPQNLDKAVRQMLNMLKQIRRLMSRLLYIKLNEDFKKYEKLIINKNYKSLSCDCDFKKQRLLFALLMWSDEKYTVKHLYETFAVNYMQMKRFAETVSYRLDIIRLALSVANIDGGQTLYQKLGSKRLHKAEEWLQELSDEIFYRIPVHICHLLNLQCTDPKEALKVRDVAKIYADLNAMMNKDGPPNKKEHKRIQNICDKIETWEPEWRNIFYKQFGGILSDGN